MGILANCLYFTQQRIAPVCLLCESRLLPSSATPAVLCASCDADLPRVAAQHCMVCALPLASGMVCGACLADPPAYDHVCTAFVYAFPADALIQSLKYANRLAIAPILAAALIKQIEEMSALPDVLIPMPLSENRLRERGFNQAQEIARHIAKHTGVPLTPHACRKVKDTPPQAALPWKERAKNVRNAFVCDADFTGKHVGLIDDVMTTGATLDELAKRLKQCGAVRVTGIVAARTLPFGE